MQITLNISNTENLTKFTDKDEVEIQEILTALVQCGGLTGVKGGKTIIHFDAEGNFQKIEVDYFPWVRKSKHFDSRR